MNAHVSLPVKCTPLIGGHVQNKQHFYENVHVVVVSRCTLFIDGHAQNKQHFMKMCMHINAHVGESECGCCWSEKVYSFYNWSHRKHIALL